MPKKQPSLQEMVASVLSDMQTEKSDPTNNRDILNRLRNKYHRWMRLPDRAALKSISNVKNRLKTLEVVPVVAIPEAAVSEALGNPKPAAKQKKVKATPPAAHVNKMALVRQALAAVGPEAPPSVIQSYIKAQLKVDLPLGLVGAYKSQIITKQRRDKLATKQPQKVAARTTEPRLGEVLDALTAIQPIVERFGSVYTKRMIDVLNLK